jgi:hypothetical protein
MRFGAGIGIGLLLVMLMACSSGYQQGRCDPGYLEVDGECRLAVGQPCQKDAECLGRSCLRPQDLPPFCSISCRDHDDCPSGFFCSEPFGRHCYPGQPPLPCTDDSACQPCQRCQEGECRALTGCRICAGDTDCPSCLRCETGECSPVAGCKVCAADTDCPACQDCDARGECRRKAGCILCQSSDDCPGCYECRTGACVAIEGCGSDPCFNDSFCPPRTRCLYDATLGHSACLPIGLAFGADCERGGDAVCREGICAVFPDGSLHCSRSCLEDAGCPDGYVCGYDPLCRRVCIVPQASLPGPSCRRDADCSDGRVCAPLLDDFGTVALRCQEPLPCAGSSGDPCPQDGRCQSRLCTPESYCSPPCQNDLDCPVGFLCDEIEMSVLGTTVSLSVCATRESVRADFGEICPAGDSDCKSGMCLHFPAGGPHAFCSIPCSGAGADCPDRYLCQTGAEPPVEACLPDVLDGACGSNADCPPEQVCVLSGTLAGPTCRDPFSSGAEPGEVCNETRPCRNFLCLAEGLCGAVCRSGSDCPAGFICDYIETLIETGQKVFSRICVPDPGSMRPCRIDGDCPAAEVCTLELNPWGTALEGRCAPRWASGALGQACAAAFDCENRICPANGACTRLCVSDGDCPAPFECVPLRVSPWAGASFSILGCRDLGQGELGDPCPHGAPDCVSGICFHSGDLEPYCSAVCQGDQDCPAAGMYCGDGSPRYCEKG